MNLCLTRYLKGINKIIEEIDQRSGLKFRSTTHDDVAVSSNQNRIRRVSTQALNHDLPIHAMKGIPNTPITFTERYQELELIGAEGSLLEFLGNDSIHDSFSGTGSDLPDFNFNFPS